MLPSSTTSGLSELESDVVSFSTMPVHCWRSNCTSSFGCSALNWATALATTGSGVSPPLSQRRTVVALATAGAMASTAAPASPIIAVLVLVTCLYPLYVSVATAGQVGEAARFGPGHVIRSRRAPG